MTDLRALAVPLARKVMGTGYALANRLGFYDPGRQPICYVVEKADWVIRNDALAYAAALEAIHPGMVRVTDRPETTPGKIAHFGSQFHWQAWAGALSSSTRTLITYFHGQPEDGPEMARHVDFFMRNVGRLERVVTAASRIEARLLSWGVPREKLIRVPLGIDLTRFCPPSAEERRQARARFGIPEGSICIGSFQKDGSGWGEGMEPKLIKGPDIFVDCVARLTRDFPVFVLLTGPARGYVMAGLETAGVPYSHHLMPRADMVADAFKALDLYIVASREEGGPKAVLESLASGVPLVSTRVGMAEDVVRDGRNGCLADRPDAAVLADRAAHLLSRPEEMRAMAEHGREDVKAFAWDVVAETLRHDVYAPLLEP